MGMIVIGFFLLCMAVTVACFIAFGATTKRWDSAYLILIAGTIISGLLTYTQVMKPFGF